MGRAAGAESGDDRRWSQDFVDATRPATLNDGAGKQTDFATVREAVAAWRALPSVHKIRAMVKVIGGPVYSAHRSIGSTT
jgi:hypothetical protein